MASSSDLPRGLQTAQTLLEKERYRAACNAFSRIVGVDEYRAAAQHGWGKGMAALENFDEAASHFRDAIGADPENPAFYADLNAIWSEIDNSEALIQKLQSNVSRLDTCLVHRNWADFLRGKRDALAVEEYERASRLGERDVRMNINWGLALAAIDRHEQAVERLEDALLKVQAGTAENDELWRAMVVLLSALETPDQMIDRIQAHVEKLNSWQLRLKWARTLYQLKRPGAGAAEYGKVLESQHRNPSVWLDWGGVLHELGDDEQAVVKYCEAIESNPLDSGAYLNFLLAAKKNKDEGEKAIAKVQEIVDRSGTAVAHFVWALALLMAYLPDKALNQIRIAKLISATDVQNFLRLQLTQLAYEAAQDKKAGKKTTSSVVNHAEAMLRLVVSKRKSRKFPPNKELLQAFQQEVNKIDAAVIYWIFGIGMDIAGNADAALEQYRKAVFKDPDDAFLHWRFGEFLARQGRHKEALEQFIRAAEIKIGGRGACWPVHGSFTLLDPEARVSAIQRLQQACDRSPENPGLRFMLGIAFLADRRFPRAVSSFAQAIKLGSGEKESLDAACEGLEVALARDDSDRSRALIEEEIKTIDGAYAYRAWGQVLVNLERLGPGIRQFSAALSKKSASAALRAEYANWLVLAGEVDSGKRQYEAAADRDPQSGIVLHLWGLSLTGLRQYVDAVEKFQQAYELDYSRVLFDWALALDGMGAREAMLDKYKEAIQQARANPVNQDLVTVAYCKHNVANSYEKEGNFFIALARWEEALSAYEEAARNNGSELDSMFFLYHGSVWAEIKYDFDKAEQLYRRARERNPGNTRVLAAIVALNISRKENIGLGQNKTKTKTTIVLPAALTKACAKARTLVTSRSDAVERERQDELVVSYQAAAREAYDEAKRILSRRLEELNIASTQIELGQLHFSMSEYEEAKCCFELALAQDPDSAEAAAYLGETCLHLEEFKRALGCLKRALSQDPLNLGYRTNLARVHLKLKELEKAETEYGKVLDVAPGSVDALLGMGNTYLAMAEEFQKDAKASDVDNMVSRALEYFSRARRMALTDHGSRKLKLVEDAALSYKCGYANVMRYEAQTITTRDAGLLATAKKAFEKVPVGDPNYFKAQRAKIKIDEYKRPLDQSTRSKTRGVFWAALLMFAVANYVFLMGQPKLDLAFRVSDQSLERLASDKVSKQAMEKLKALAEGEALPALEFNTKIGAALGDELWEKYGPHIRDQAAKHWMVKHGDPIKPEYYALLSFGALMFMVAGLYLQQLSKLKFGSFQLEKSSESTRELPTSLGITR